MATDPEAVAKVRTADCPTGADSQWVMRALRVAICIAESGNRYTASC